MRQIGYAEAVPVGRSAHAAQRESVSPSASTARSSSSWVTTSGGEIRIVDAVRVLDQHAARSERLADGPAVAPAAGPRPRPPTARRRAPRGTPCPTRPASRSCRWAPRSRARASRSPSSSRLITARPTAHASGLPPKVLPCWPGRRTPRTSASATTADSGRMPPPERLAEQVDVGVDTRGPRRQQVPGAPEPRLHLVGDEQHAGGRRRSPGPRPGSRRAARSTPASPWIGSTSTATVSRGDRGAQCGEVAVGHDVEAGGERAEPAARVRVGGEADDGRGATVEAARRRRRSGPGPRARPSPRSPTCGRP